MRRDAGLWVVAMLTVSLLGALPRSRAAVSPVTTSQQLEADWLRQEELRETAAGADARATAGNVRPEQDAAGGCDGVKDGKWGFHTQDEPNPWWRVDLGRQFALDHLLVFNRCDACGERNTRIIVWLSDDDKNWRQVYRHNGTMFYGYSDKKPLEVKLAGAKARYVRLGLAGRSYFHLDEVEVYAVGDAANIALKKPATQSSTSPWSVAHDGRSAPQALTAVVTTYATPKVIARGLRLADDLRLRGVQVDADVQALEQVGERLKQLPKDAPGEVQRKLNFEARAAVRRLALRNPLLDFDAVLFVKHAPGRFPHMSDQFYGWWSRPGGGVFVLQGFKGRQPKLRCLTADMGVGSFIRPDLSYDGKKVLFAYAKYYAQVPDIRDKANKANVPEEAFFHIYEMNLDGTGRRQLTRGRYDDFDARYLPGGDIVFVSTRKGLALQCSKASAEATTQEDLPDSYVRCGGDQYRPVPVFTLHAMSGDGRDLRPISAFENFEWTPSVASDGRILYTRWDYIDRFNGNFFSLWSTNPDGTNPQLVYGNYTARPQVKFEARSIPGSQKLIITAGPHHSNVGGSLVLLDRTRGMEEAAPIVRLTPEVPFPETEGWANMYYANPFPLSEEHYLVAWSDRKLPPHCRVDDSGQNPVNATGLYLYDAFGNLNLLYRDPEISSECPIPVRARPKPAAFPNTVDWDGPQEGCFMLQDVYDGLSGVERGTVKRLRIVAVPPKVQPNMNSPSLGISAEDPGKFVLGTVPVEADGSAYFRVPSGVPVFFQALDEQGLALQTMRSLTYVQAQQTLSCVGCHESRDSAPRPSGFPRATTRPPSKLRPGPEGSWPLRYDRLVQPVLDKHCISCHSQKSDKPRASKLDLTAAQSYDSLLNFGNKDLHKLAFERDRSMVGEMPARKSKLYALLIAEKGHEGVRLDADSLQRLVTWMDTYACRQGYFSAKQEGELTEFRKKLEGMLEK